MKPCPFCGTMLAAALVADILDPKQPEFCPTNPPKSEARKAAEDDLRRRAQGEADGLKRLTAYALLGSFFGAPTVPLPISTQEGTK